MIYEMSDEDRAEYEQYLDECAQREYLEREYPVVCFACGLADIGTEPGLQKNGWLLWKETLCPKCHETERMAESQKAVEDRVREDGNNKVRRVLDRDVFILRPSV